MEKMKAMVLHAPGPVESRPLSFEEIPIPSLDDDEVLIKIHACGVCHTDLHTVEGEIALPKLPVIPGHQIVGTIVKKGKKVNKRSVGQRVGVTWLNSSCGKCEYCKNGLENLCDNIRFTGLHANGGYAEYTAVKEDYTFLIPEGFGDLEAAPLLCAGIIGYRSLRLSQIKPGQRLGLYGFGASAHIAIQIAKYWKCEVYVFTRSEEHKKHALQLGARWVGNAQDEPPKKLDSAVIFAPAGWIVPYALKALKKGGTLAINAIHMSPIPQMEYRTIYYEKTLRSVANLTRQDAEEFLDLVPRIPVKTDFEAFPLDAANDALLKLKKSLINGAAVLKME
ncbi:MAG: alcohol dehydrogenase, propanol-preferring [Thermotogota bacterium]|nr:alcohol dehydrogenase, propanol-preferring [Thermotogota bacterium]